MISGGYVNVSFTLGVGASWRTTEATCKVPAGAPTVSAPTKEFKSKGYPTNNPTRMVAGNTIVRINMSGTPSSATHSAINNYTLYIDGVKQTPTTNNYFDLPVMSAGTHTIKYYATDNNGISSSDSSTLSLLYETYTAPVIDKLTSQRWSSNSSSGHAQDDGTYARLSLAFTPGKIGSTNLTTKWKVQVSSFTSTDQATSGAVVFSGSILGDGTYQVRYSIWDAYVSTPIVRADTISMAGRGALDLFYDNGVHGVGFGTAGEAGKANFKFTPYFECNSRMVSLVDIVYPVGSIYISTKSTNPSSLFPSTTWARITDTFLYAGTDSGTYKVGSTGGDKTQTLQLKNYRKRMYIWQGGSGGAGGTPILNGDYMAYGQNYNFWLTDSDNEPFDIMPPYKAVYMWERTA